MRLMAQKAIEVILARQLASYLGLPVFIVDPDGTLLFYNDPAEAILGQRFAETGELPMAAWSTRFRPTELDGSALPPEALPLVIALRDRQPAHRDMLIVGLDGERRHIEVTAFPLIGQGGRFLGGVAIFWERSP